MFSQMKCLLLQIISFPIECFSLIHFHSFEYKIWFDQLKILFRELISFEPIKYLHQDNFTNINQNNISLIFTYQLINSISALSIQFRSIKMCFALVIILNLEIRSATLQNDDASKTLTDKM